VNSLSIFLECHSKDLSPDSLLVLLLMFIFFLLIVDVSMCVWVDVMTILLLFSAFDSRSDWSYRNIYSWELAIFKFLIKLIVCKYSLSSIVLIFLWRLTHFLLETFMHLVVLNSIIKFLFEPDISIYFLQQFFSLSFLPFSFIWNMNLFYNHTINSLKGVII